MAITTPTLWLDGALAPATGSGAPVIPAMGHAIQRGSLVFDVGSFQAGALFRARDHVRRFLRSARIVGLEVAPSEDTLVEAAVAVAKATGASTGMIRWSAFYRADNADLVPRDPRASVVVAGQLYEHPPAPAGPGTVLKIATFDDARKAGPSVLPPEAKAGAAYLGPMLARKRAIAAGADDVVLLDDDGCIAEGPIANTFAVIAGELWTPALGRILPGITRDTVLTLARELGIRTREEPLPRTAFQNADEAFMSGTSLPLAPISKIDAREVAAPGPITARLLEAVRAARWRRSHPDWLIAIG